MSESSRHPLIRWAIEAGIIPEPDDRVPERTPAELAPLLVGDRRALAYAQGAFTSEIAELENASSGTRNGALFQAACNLGEFIEAGLLDRQTVRQALIAACRTNGYIADDGLKATEDTIRSGFRTVAGKPRAGIPENADDRGSGTDPDAYWNPADFGLPSLDRPPPASPGGPPIGPGGDPPGGDPPDGNPGGGSSSSRRYQVSNPVDAFEWLLAEMGRNGLSGLLRRGPGVVYTARVNEDGYVAPSTKDDDNGPATVQSATIDVLIARLSLNYYVFKESVQEVTDQNGATQKIRRETRIFFPAAAVRTALAAVDEAVNLRPLRGVTHTPMVRKDGSILDAPGYDVATGFLYVPTVEVPTVPEDPTVEQVDRAVALLHGMIDQFRWASDHDEANFLGLLLTPLLRELTPPPYKLGAIMARQPGSGKSLLAEIIRAVHGGVFRSEMPHDDAELAKSLTGILTCTTAAVVQFDNVSGVVRSSRLAGLLTSNVYSDRILGSTSQVDMTNDRMWLLTGNNLAFGGDLIRRTLWVTVDPGQPDPHLRTGFTLPLPGWAYEHRGEIIQALLILVRSWVMAGEPRPPRQTSDSYAHWSSTVRGILAHTRTVLGEPRYAEHAATPTTPWRNRRFDGGFRGEFDHGESVQQRLGTDDEGWGEFLAAVYALYGDQEFTVRELVDDIDTVSANHELARAVADALPGELHEKYLRAHESARAVGKSLGMWLRNRVGRWAGELVCEKGAFDADQKVQRWRVRRLPRVKSSDA